jgi:hypothetical protein
MRENVCMCSCVRTVVKWCMNACGCTHTSDKALAERRSCSGSRRLLVKVIFVCIRDKVHILMQTGFKRAHNLLRISQKAEQEGGECVEYGTKAHMQKIASAAPVIPTSANPHPHT